MRAAVARAAVAALLLGLSTAVAGSYAALQRATELQYWDATRAQNGYNFFGVGGTTYLLDMEGRVVHTWPIGTNPHLLSDGSVLDASTDDPSGFGSFKQVAWDGTTVWTYKEFRSTYHPHHDFTRIWNPKLKAYTTLFIANKDLTYAQLVAAGADPSRTPSTGAQMDAIVEVDASGTVVWEWCFFDHVVQDYDSTKPNYVGSGKTVSDWPGKLNINLAGHNLKADWLHCNSLDYNGTLDRIVVNSVQGEFYVIDHGGTFVVGDPAASLAKAATSAGDFLYRFGDPARYGQGEKPAILEDWTLSTQGTKQLGGSHNIQWIPEGLPGAGHFLVFNNAEYLSEHTAQSYVVEINPYLDANGNDTGAYVNPPDAGYVLTSPPAVTDKTPRKISRQVVWTYATKSSLTLFATIGSGAQRLPNGNTLVCGDNDGYVSEVTPAGAAVWEYVVPVTKSGKLLVLGDRIPMTNSIFRAYRYLATDPALAGRALTAGTTIAGRTTVENPYAGDSSYRALQRPTETQYWDQANAYGGYTLFAAQGKTYLIDMQGRVAHSWTGGTDPRLLESGNLLDWATSAAGAVGLRERDWTGNTVWEYFEKRSTYHPHGDFRRIWDPKLGAYATLYLANRDVTAAQCLVAGCDPADAPYDGAQVDTVVEVDMSGNVVWEWSFWDHAVQAIDATKANYAGAGKRVSDWPGKIDLNLPGRPLRANWLDCNSLDYNQALDQVLVNSRQGEMYVIDRGNTFVAGDPAASLAKAATSAGDFLWRFGDPARYGQGNPPSVGTNWETATSGNKQIGGSSNAQWIASGLPGAGRILVFNNNQYLYQRTPQSYVFEVNPYVGSAGSDTGAYVNPPAAGYTTWTFEKDTMKASQQLSKQVVWKYGSLSNLTLFSHFGSSAQRLPNGNTLICATTEGYFLEIDASGNAAWEYINPVTDEGIVAAIGDDLPMSNAVPRALRYAASYAGLAGRDLTAAETIVDGASPVAGFTWTPAVPAPGETVTFTDTSTNDPTAWAWTFGDGGTSSLRSPTHSFASAGTFDVALTATNAKGSGMATKTLTVASSGSLVTATRFLPIVLDVTGRARYTSELTLANRGTTAATVALTYTPAPAFGTAGAGTVSLSLAAGRQLVVADALAFLRTNGLAIPAGNQGGSLRATFSGLSAAEASFAGVRITAPSENGRSGVSYVAPRVEDLPTGASRLFGLRTTADDRTNLALANASTTSTLTLRVTLVNGNGTLAESVLPDVTLAPGAWTQIGDVLVGTGVGQGWARVTVVSGTGPYAAYAVFNDNGTNDGSYVPFEPEPLASEARLVPVVVEAGPYATELVLTNPSSSSREVTMTYVESLSPAKGAGGTVTETLLAGEQRLVTDLFGYLRGKLPGSIGAKGDGSYAGALQVKLSTGSSTASGFAGARVASPAKTVSGSYGLFAPGIGASGTATTEAWVYGLRQDAEVRTNLAVSAATNDAPMSFAVEVYDGATGQLKGTTDVFTLVPGGWKQISGILSGTGVAQGYARIAVRSGTGRFAAYAVVNDGAAPGSATATDDGSYLPFANR